MTDLEPAPDLRDVSRCPVGKRCNSCGRRGDRMADGVALVVRTSTTLVGVICFTSCPACVKADSGHRDLGANVFSAILHAGHCGVSYDSGWLGY